jgi:hypothetical protein
VAHPVHQFTRTRTASRREAIPGMAKIVKVEANRQAGLHEEVGPVDRPVEVVPPQRRTQRPVTDADWPDSFQETRAIADDLAVIERETKARFRTTRPRPRWTA